MSVAQLVTTKPDAERAAEFRRRLNEALRDHVQPIIRELEADGFVAHFASATPGGTDAVQCSHLAKHFTD
jgi:hypothetical protein